MRETIKQGETGGKQGIGEPKKGLPACRAPTTRPLITLPQTRSG